MSNPLHAPYYADLAVWQTCPVVENVRIAQDTYRLRVATPEIARSICPGQFLMVRLANCDDPLIGRPLALYDIGRSTSGKPETVDVVYLVKGKLTSRLCECQPDHRLDVWGPLGNGFEPRDAEHLIMVAGGIGQTPFVALARECLGKDRFGDPPRTPCIAARATICLGARTASLLAGIEDFERAGTQVRISTDDGSRGHHGLVTDLLKQTLEEASESVRVVCCGPEPMMQAVAEITGSLGIPCEVSLETPMACGIGICFTCVAKVRDGSGRWDYKRTCVEGPVFDAQTIDWS